VQARIAYARGRALNSWTSKGETGREREGRERKGERKKGAGSEDGRDGIYEWREVEKDGIERGG